MYVCTCVCVYVCESVFGSVSERERGGKKRNYVCALCVALMCVRACVSVCACVCV